MLWIYHGILEILADAFMYYNTGAILANDVSVSKRQNGYKVAT